MTKHSIAQGILQPISIKYIFNVFVLAYINNKFSSLIAIMYRVDEFHPAYQHIQYKLEFVKLSIAFLENLCDHQTPILGVF